MAQHDPTGDLGAHGPVGDIFGDPSVARVALP